MRPIRGGYLSFYNRKGLRGISFFVMAAPPFTVTVSGILRSSLSAYNNDCLLYTSPSPRDTR